MKRRGSDGRDDGGRGGWGIWSGVGPWCMGIRGIGQLRTIWARFWRSWGSFGEDFGGFWVSWEDLWGVPGGVLWESRAGSRAGPWTSAGRPARARKAGQKEGFSRPPPDRKKTNFETSRGVHCRLPGRTLARSRRRVFCSTPLARDASESPKWVSKSPPLWRVWGRVPNRLFFEYGAPRLEASTGMIYTLVWTPFGASRGDPVFRLLGQQAYIGGSIVASPGGPWPGPDFEFFFDPSRTGRFRKSQMGFPGTPLWGALLRWPKPTIRLHGSKKEAQNGLPGDAVWGSKAGPAGELKKT